MALLDGIIRELEDTREAALRTAETASAPDRAAIQAALVELEAKLGEARLKRDEVRERMARTARIRTLVAEMANLTAESATLDKVKDAKRTGEIKARIEEIRTEAESLKMKSA